MSWRECLPTNKFEYYILLLGRALALIALGFMVGIVYQMYSFERGLDYMKRLIYDGKIVVERVIAR